MVIPEFLTPEQIEAVKQQIGGVLSVNQFPRSAEFVTSSSMNLLQVQQLFDLVNSFGFYRGMVFTSRGKHLCIIV